MSKATAVYPQRIFKTKLSQLMSDGKKNDNWLALFLGVTPTTANRIKNGIDLKLSHALKISKHFNISVEELWCFR